jgi:hypothetical protein
MQARMTCLLESATSFTTGVGFLLGGVVVSLTSAPTAYAVSGAGVVVLLVLGGILARRATAGAPDVERGPSDVLTSVPALDEATSPIRRSRSPVE